MTTTHSLDQLCGLADLPKRTLRDDRQRGLVDRPVGEARAAHFTPVHGGQLMPIRQLSDACLSPERLHEVLAGGESPAPERQHPPGAIRVLSHVHMAPGFALPIAPQAAGLSPRTTARFCENIMPKWEQQIEA